MTSPQIIILKYGDHTLQPGAHNAHQPCPQPLSRRETGRRGAVRVSIEKYTSPVTWSSKHASPPAVAAGSDSEHGGERNDKKVLCKYAIYRGLGRTCI
jgi:hypothetical protein